jgi:hypothetical protein
MSRHVVSIGAVFLVLAGLIPKLAAVISAMPSAVLGGAAIVMFAMVAAAGVPAARAANRPRTRWVRATASASVTSTDRGGSVSDRLIARVDPKMAPRKGEKVHLKIKVGAEHCFSAKTGERLLG